MRSREEIEYVLSLFNLWIESGLISHMETEGDAQLIYAVRESLRWATGAKSNSFDKNIIMFKQVLTDNGIMKIN